MEVPPRARVSIARPGGIRQVFYAGLIMSLLLATSLVIIGFKFGLANIYIFAGIFALFVANIVVWAILCRVEYKHLISVLRFYGFEMHSPKTLCSEYGNICNRAELGLRNDPLLRAFVKADNKREVLVSQHQSIGHHNYSISTRWIVQSNIELPFALIRDKSLFVDHEQNLGRIHFDKQKSLSAKKIATVRSLLTPVVDWFLISEDQAKEQQLTKSQLNGECWLLDGKWVLLEVKGTTTAQGMIQMANFVIAFVEELEMHAASIDLYSELSSSS